MKRLVLRQSTRAVSGKSYRIDYAQELNPAQLEAVMHTEGPALVLAGAGTGKTRTLTYRVARLVEDGIDPTSILLLTFTRKASREMLRRAGALLDGRCDKVSGGTFHAFAFSMMQRFRDRVTVLDQSDAEDVMNLVRGRFDVAKLKKRFPHKGTLLDMCSTSINTITPLEDVVSKKYPHYIDEAELINEVIRAYHLYKQQSSVVDYDDLLLHLLAMTHDEEISQIIQMQFKHVMVDEYQDVNALQHEIIQGISGQRGNVLVVGDDAQSIYAFRGADVRNIHQFPNSFETCRIIKLEHNYRSTQPILDVCNLILKDAVNMFDKELFSDRKDGDAPMLVACTNERQQSLFIVQQVLDLRENGLSLNDIAVLIRSGFLSFDLEIELGKANIPFRKVGGLKFAEAAHVKDLLALLRITANPRDVISWYRVLMLQKGVGRKSAQNIIEQFAQFVNPLEDLTVNVSGTAAKAVEELRGVLNRACSVTNVHERVSFIANEYRPTLERTYDDHLKRWKDVETVIAICSRYSTTEQFLADIALDPPTETLNDIDEDDKEMEYLTISTIHSAKGLEWNTVFAIWVNEGRIPSAKSAESEATLEEERRLLYVASTRAKERLIFTYPTLMFEWEHTDVLGRESRFLEGAGGGQCPKYYLTEESAS